LDATAHWAFLYRGLLSLYAGNGAKALADISQAADLDPKDPFNALWLDIVGQRNGVQSRLPVSAAQIDLAKWPGPIVKLFLGQLTPEAVLASVDEAPGRNKKRQICQANFYIGVWHMRNEQKEEGTRLLKLAESDCYKTQLEWRAATAELKAPAA